MTSLARAVHTEDSGRRVLAAALGVAAVLAHRDERGTGAPGRPPTSRSSPTRRPPAPSARSSPPSRRRRPARTSRSSSPTAPRARRPPPCTTACRPTSSTSRSRPTSRCSRRPASSARPGTRIKFGGMVTDSIVVFVVRKGNPEEHQDLGRPDQAGHPGHQPEPVHLGRRALERHGRVGRADQAAQDRRSRPTPTSPRSTRTSPCRTRARAPR